MLRTTRINPKLSAYAILEETYNFNNTPMAPPGTRAMVYIDPKMRCSWETLAKDRWYVGTTPDYYRCYGGSEYMLVYEICNNQVDTNALKNKYLRLIGG